MRGSGIGKNVDAAALLEHARLRLGRHLCYSCEEPVGRPALATIDAEWEAASPACQAGKLPATNESIQKTACIIADGPASAQRQICNPIKVELMCEVEVRDRTG